jgi:hypothetical protein
MAPHRLTRFQVETIGRLYRLVVVVQVRLVLVVVHLHRLAEIKLNHLYSLPIGLLHRHHGEVVLRQVGRLLSQVVYRELISK